MRHGQHETHPWTASWRALACFLVVEGGWTAKAAARHLGRQGWPLRERDVLRALPPPPYEPEPPSPCPPSATASSSTSGRATR